MLALPLSELHVLLAALKPGPVRRLAELRRALDASWYVLLSGSQSPLRANKTTRIQAATWEPPILHVEIARQEAAAAGSDAPSQIQRWAIDVDADTADLAAISWRGGPAS